MANYPLPKFHFIVDWGGVASVGFTDVSGLDITRDVIEYRDGSSPEFSKIKMPGMQKYSNITLKRGTFKSNNEFYTWLYSNINKTGADMTRRDITISLLDEEHNPVVTWKVHNAWPCKITSTDLKSTDSTDVAIETLELAHEGLTIQND
jgi:phage tail-like protein